MALEELIRQHEKQADLADAGGAAVKQETGSLIQRAKAFAVPQSENDPEPAEEWTDDERFLRCADGYVRRSPIQYYHTADDYHKRRARKAAAAAGIVCLAVLLIVVLVRSGILRF